MSSPAIVLMTDPSRCNLGDVHHLVQALVEIQQMGQHAIPQAFCDHPEAAEGFIDAYTRAYPQLVLDDREIPTPDHLHSLISSGQIGPIGLPPEPKSIGGLPPPPETSGANAFPIVVLTLGSSQVLLDALQQSPTMRESIRLIDVGPERADPLAVSIAEAVAIRGLDGEPWQHARSSMDRLELDEIPGAWKAEATSLALHDDQMSLDVVETVDVSRSERPAYDQVGEHGPDTIAPAAPVVPPAPAAAAERAGPALPNDGPAGAATAEPATEPASQPASQPVASLSDSSDLVVPDDIEPVAPEAHAPDESAGESGGQVEESPEGRGPAEDVDEDVDEEVAAVKEAGRLTRDPDDDVAYPPVGSLIAGADVVYPMLDQGAAHAVLHELASVLLDDEMFDPDPSADFIAGQRGGDLPVPAHREAIVPGRPADKAVTFDGYGEQESEDLADASTRPLHDSDL